MAQKMKELKANRTWSPEYFRTAEGRPMISPGLWAALLCFIALWSLSLSASAQSGQGSITGRVTDQTAAGLPHALVTIRNNDTQSTTSIRTNNQGFYSVGSLNPATYSVTVTAKGFGKSIVEEVVLQAAATVSVDVSLKIGSEDVSVTVTAQDALLSKDTSDVTTTVDHSLVESLPYPERSSLEAALLVPGVLGDPTASGGIQPENPGISAGPITPGASISIAGAPAGTSSIVVDGSDVTQASYPRAGVNLSGRLVQETTVITGGLSAKYGRTGGGIIVQATRGGTSDYHGAITWRHTDPAFQAKQLTANPIPPALHENFYGFYLGGPIWLTKVSNWRHQTFFYVGVEPARLKNTTGFRATFFTPDDLAGHLNNTLPLLNLTTLKNSGYAAALAAPRIGGLYYHADASGYGSGAGSPTSPIYNPNCAGHVGVPCGPSYINSGAYVAIPNNDVSGALAQNPFAQYVMSLMPTPSNPGPYATFDNSNGTYANDGTNGSYLRGVENADNRYSIRIDTQINNTNKIFVRFTAIPIVANRFYALAESNPLNQTPKDVANNYDVAVGYTHVFSNAVVNNAHYSFLRGRDVRTLPTSASTQDFGAKYGLTPAALGYGFPSLGGFNVSGVTYQITGGVSPSAASGPGAQVDQNFIFVDDVTVQRGRHLFQFGADLRWIQSNEYDNNYTTGGAYTFSQSNTNNGSSGGAPLATFQLGLVSSYTDSPIPVPAYYRWRYDAGYLQDDWRATSRITLNLGLRYNLETPRMEKNNNQPVIALNQSYSANGSTSNAALCFAGNCGISKYLWPLNKLEFEPRVGISIATSNRTTVRAAYSILHLPLTGYYNQPLPDLSLGGTLGSLTGGALPNQIVDFMTNPVTAPTSYYPALDAGRGAPISKLQGIVPIYVNQTNAVPYTQTWNVTLQYEPKANTLIQATYQGLKGTHLIAPMNSQSSGDINVPSVPTLAAQIMAHANLGATLSTCSGASPAIGCGNPFGVQQGTSTVQETKLQALNPYQNFFNNNIPDDFERDGNSAYHALLLSVTHREGRNLSLLANYVWSKSIDDVANTTFGNNGASQGSPAPQDPFNLRAERSVSISDQPSRLKVGYTYTLPIGAGQRFKTRHRLVNNLIGNISTSGIYTVQSGFPNYVTLGSAGYFVSLTPKGMDGCTPSGTAMYCSSTGLPAGYTLRPDRVPGVQLINKNWKHGGGGALSSNFVPYINPAAFTTPGSQDNPRLGNAPRTLSDARSPRESYFDARFVKGFHFHSRYQLNLTATLNNAFNHPLFFSLNTKNLQNANTIDLVGGTITPTLASTTFGQINNNSAGFSRVIRVGAEFTF
jgi:hypothetical protein